MTPTWGRLSSPLVSCSPVPPSSSAIFLASNLSGDGRRLGAAGCAARVAGADGPCSRGAGGTTRRLNTFLLALISAPVAIAETLVTEIVLLALVALFVGLRLYSVLGRRTGHEQQPILRPAETPAAAEAPAPLAELPAERPERTGLVYEEPAAPGIRAIVTADPEF